MSNDHGQGRRYPIWSIVVAVLVGLATVICFVVGIALSSGDGQTPREGYALTVLLTILSVAAGWVIALLMQQSKDYDRRVDEAHKTTEMENASRSAVVRVFRTLDGLGRLQELTQSTDGTAPKLRNQLELTHEAIQFIFANAEDSVDDWRRIAPDAVEEELNKARSTVQRERSGGSPGNE